LDDVAVLRIEHGKANAIDLDLFDALDARLSELESSPAVAAVLTGTGGIFSAGVDLFKVRAGGRDYLETCLPRLSTSLTRLFDFPLPVVAAVNGHAIAGGLILALACDYRVMAEGAGKVGLTELLVGVPFPAAPLEIVRFQVPARKARDLVFSGRTLPAEEALALGLVDELAPAASVVARAVAAARRYSAIPRRAFAATKRHFRAPAVAAIRRYEREHDPEVLAEWSRPETLERIGEFLEKTVGKRG
jgi:enoyl-CoA hydratase